MKRTTKSKKMVSTFALSAGLVGLFQLTALAQTNAEIPAQPQHAAEPAQPPLISKVPVQPQHPQNGVEKTYYDKGALKSERTFKDGKPDGRAVFYYESGKIMTEVVYKNGKRDGVQRSYYEDGKVKEEMDLSNGKLNGKHKEFDVQGRVTSEKEYQNAVQMDKKN